MDNTKVQPKEHKILSNRWYDVVYVNGGNTVMHGRDLEHDLETELIQGRESQYADFTLLPEDYEPCADCGYDHQYEASHAYSWHSRSGESYLDLY